VLSNTGANFNDGSLVLASGQQFRIESDARLSNTGSLNLNNGQVTGAGSLVNGYGGIISGSGRIAANFDNAGGTLVVERGTTTVVRGFANSGLVQLDSAAASLAGGTLENHGSVEGRGQIGNALTNRAEGTVEAIGGTLVLAGTISNQGTFATGTGAKLLASKGLADNQGLISLTGGTFDNNGKAMANHGDIVGYGVLRSGGLDNQGKLVIAGGTATVNGPVSNGTAGRIEVSHAPAVFTGAVVNNGVFKNTGGSATFAGGYTENGAYLSDPAINHYTTLTVNATGYLSGGTGDEFHVSGDFVNHSEQNTLWSTSDAALFFDGGGSQSFYLAGADYGATAAGYSDNFAWGSLTLGSGTTLNLFDGNADPSAALYVENIALSGIDAGNLFISSLLGAFNIYYDRNSLANAYLGGLTYSFSGGGRLIAAHAAPVPIPTALWLFGSALAGMALVGRRKDA
jgi:hypothetical protein